MRWRIVGRWLNILDYALHSLRRKMMKNTTVFMVFSIVVFLFASFQLMRGALTELATVLLASSPDITVQQLLAGRQTTLDSQVKARLERIYGIAAIEDRIWGYYFDESNGANYTVIGLQNLDKPQFTAPWVKMVDGRLPKTGERGAAIISEQVKLHLQLGTRKNFSLFRPDLSLASFTTTGMFTRQADVLTADTILLTLADARDLFAIPRGQVTDLLVWVSNPAEIEMIATKISEIVPGSRVITKSRIAKSYTMIFNWRSGLGTLCLITALAAFVILAWDKASGLSQEDLREVGILRILGWQTEDILLLRFLESGVISFCAFAVGYLAAWLHVAMYNGALFRPVMLGWSVLRPTVTVVPPFIWSDVFVVVSVSVIPYLCATAIPAWRAAVIRPDSVL